MSVCSTDEYEVQLLSYALKDMDFFKKAKGLVASDFFNSVMASVVFSLESQYIEKYEKLPNKDELLHLYKISRNSEDDSTINQYLSVLYNLSINKQFIEDELSRYTRVRKMENLLRKNYEELKTGNDVDISNVISDLFRIQTDTVSGINYGVDMAHIVDRVDEYSPSIVVPTSIPELNKILGGGLGSGQLGIILAPPNYGKTMLLCNLALYAFLKGYKVLFVTMEMYEFSIVKRLSMMMAGVLGRFVDMNVIRTVKEQCGGDLRVLYKPVRSIGSDYLLSVYHWAEADGVKFDAIFIDYADLLSSQTRYKEKRHELSSIFDSLKALGQILDIPIWSATQANRDSLSSEVITMKHLSEDFSKGMISDVIISVNSKIKANENVELFLTKYREGNSDLYIPCNVSNNMWITDAGSSDISLSSVSAGGV